MIVRIRSKMSIVKFVRLAVAAASCLLFVAGCSVGRGGCGAGEKCPAPALPEVTVHLGIGAKSASLTLGQAARASAKPGRPTKITLSIDRTIPNVTVSDVWLVVQSRTHIANPSGATGLFRNFMVLLDRKGPLRSSETLSGTWIPVAQSGTHTVNLGISLDLGNAGTSWEVATVTV